MNLRQLLALIVLALLCVFVAANLEPARVWCFGVRAEMPLALALLLAAALGAVAALLFSWYRGRRGKGG